MLHPPTTSSLLWPGPKSEENLRKNIDNDTCGGDGNYGKFVRHPNKKQNSTQKDYAMMDDIR